jgi:hypothetical protein
MLTRLLLLLLMWARDLLLLLQHSGLSGLLLLGLLGFRLLGWHVLGVW